MWLDNVEGLISALRVLHRYLADGPQANITRRQMARACRLLGVHGENSQWMYNARDTHQRLKYAGIDPETLEVADEVRWAHAVDYMRATETFKMEGFKQWLLDHDEPSAVPARDVPARPHPRARKKQAVGEREYEKQINDRIREKST